MNKNFLNGRIFHFLAHPVGLNDEISCNVLGAPAVNNVVTKVIQPIASKAVGQELVNVESRYLPYLTVNHTRYMELFLSIDHQIVSYPI